MSTRSGAPARSGSASLPRLCGTPASRPCETMLSPSSASAVGEELLLDQAPQVAERHRARAVVPEVLAVAAAASRGNRAGARSRRPCRGPRWRIAAISASSLVMRASVRMSGKARVDLELAHAPRACATTRRVREAGAEVAEERDRCRSCRGSRRSRRSAGRSARAGWPSASTSWSRPCCGNDECSQPTAAA